MRDGKKRPPRTFQTFTVTSKVTVKGTFRNLVPRVGSWYVLWHQTVLSVRIGQQFVNTSLRPGARKRLHIRRHCRVPQILSLCTTSHVLFRACRFITTRWSKSLCVPDDYNPHTLDDLKMAITEYIRNVDHAILNTVFENTVRGVNKCLETGGGHFEHYL